CASRVRAAAGSSRSRRNATRSSGSTQTSSRSVCMPNAKEYHRSTTLPDHGEVGSQMGLTELLLGAPGPETLETLLADIVQAARAAWPGVELPPEMFLAHVRSKLGDGLPIEPTLRELHTADLYLACACARGDPHALAAFDERCLSVVDRALPRL